jgi:pimeloyl-ACP methyl ester carboxylesterase
MYFHPMPGSRLLGRTAATAAEELGFRVIAPDRPGIGLSDFQPGREVTDWPDDVAELADLLNIDRFWAVGASGGGPYALACAWKMPQRLRGVAVVSSVTPASAPGEEAHNGRLAAVLGSLSRRAPWTLRLGMEMLARVVRRSPDGPLKQLERSSPEPDREVLANPEARSILRDAGAEAFRSGGRGPAHDLRVAIEPWGFPPEDISVPVQLWHGEEDANVSPVAARWLGGTIPRCQVSFVPRAGHLWHLEHMGTVLRDLRDLSEA